jgi:hypothetical protein
MNEKTDNLFLILSGLWFDKVESGEKLVEYRQICPHWKGRLEGREYKTVTFQRGYSAKHRIVRRVLKIDVGPCPYEGWTGDYYRIHFSNYAPVSCARGSPASVVRNDQAMCVECAKE